MRDNEFDMNENVEQERAVSEEALSKIKKALKAEKRRRNKMKRSKGWAVLVCICLLAVIGSGSILSLLLLKDKFDSGRSEQQSNVLMEYQQWKSRTFSEYYDRCLEERKNAQLPETTILNDSTRNDLNAYLSSLKRTARGLEVEEFGPVSCFTNTYGYDLSEYTIAGSGNSVIFPGAVLKGDSLFQGTADYTLLSLERTPMYLTSNQSGGYSEQVEDVNYRSVSEVLENCAARNEGQKAKEWNYYMQVIKSSEELKATLGVELPKNLGGFEFGSSSSEESSSVAVIYKQTFYTVSVEPKRNAVEYFQDGVDLTALGEYEPAYVSSVDYGRMIVVLIQGKMSSEELGAKVSASIQGVGIGVGLSNICMDTELTSQLFQYGGEQKDAGLITDTSKSALGIVDMWNEFWHGSENQDTVETRINDFICTDAPAVNPVPITYTLKYLSDNSYVPAMVVSGQTTMQAERDTVRKVTITADSPVIWNISELTCVPLSATAATDYSASEFLWDSDDRRTLRGDSMAEEATQLELGDCLPYGKSGVVLGNYIEENLWGFLQETIPVTVDVTISAY